MTRQVPYPHPGEILAAEFLEPMGITAYRLAKTIHVPQTRVAAILAGTRGITADTGLRLARAFGVSDEFWMNLQRDYDAAQASRCTRRRAGRDRAADRLNERAGLTPPDCQGPRAASRRHRNTVAIKPCTRPRNTHFILPSR